ncbi:hypothetical protein OPT61_g9123 [Boeremia exigua]|uniref:Uncharacterized protein n=1 Tax=Boeremia exigua TaxID=749465 RepID=A0ACC2HVE1_9PLEO|nr:hypothetical protein OPT61_g9123 [Boeremia exigua]
MTTRRANASSAQESSSAAAPAPAVPTMPDFSSGVVMKLMGFTFAMVTLPIGTYFFTNAYVFKGNATYAGGLAALMANVVLIGYVIMAFMDDQAEQAEDAEREKKAL